jgi:hypothetical protein
VYVLLTTSCFHQRSVNKHNNPSASACAENTEAPNADQIHKPVGRLTKSKIQPFGSYRANQTTVDAEPTESVVESSGSPVVTTRAAKHPGTIVRKKDSQEASDCVSVNIGQNAQANHSSKWAFAHEQSGKLKQGIDRKAPNNNFDLQDFSSGMLCPVRLPYQMLAS